MGDPELVARAQRAAERLERSWDRWRRLHGLAAEQAQPVSSYVGYSLAEPWGRPRVVFGVGAEEAERLSALLEQDAGDDPRFSQGLLWEPGQAETGPSPATGAQPPAGPSSGAQPQVSSSNGAQPQASMANGAQSQVSSSNGAQSQGGMAKGVQSPAGSPHGAQSPDAHSSRAEPQLNGAQAPASMAMGTPTQAGPADAAQFAAAPVQYPADPGSGTQYPMDPGNGARFPGAAGQGPGPLNGAQPPGRGEQPASVPEARQGEPEPGTDPAAQWAKNMPTFQPAPTADAAGLGDRGVPPGVRADLAGWSSSELPGQASAGLAAWPSTDSPQAEGGPGPSAGREPGAREAAPRRPETGDGSPDPAAWLRLALLGPEPLGAARSPYAER